MTADEVEIDDEIWKVEDLRESRRCQWKEDGTRCLNEAECCVVGKYERFYFCDEHFDEWRGEVK